MSLLSILWHGPERAFAAQANQANFGVQCQPYLQGAVLPKSVESFHQDYNNPSFTSTIESVKPCPPQQWLYAGTLYFRCFEKVTRGSYQLIDHAVVVVTHPQQGEKPQRSQRAGVQRLPTSDSSVIRLEVDFLGLAGAVFNRCHVIDKLAQEWRAQTRSNLTWLNCGIIAASAFLVFITSTIWSQVILVAFTASQILIVIRFHQLENIANQLRQLSDIGKVVVQLRRWSYQYPSLAKDNPFLLDVEKNWLGAR